MKRVRSTDWYYANKLRCLEMQARWYQANKEKKAEYGRQYYLRNKQKILEQQRIRREKRKARHESPKGNSLATCSRFVVSANTRRKGGGESRTK